MVQPMVTPAERDWIKRVVWRVGEHRASRALYEVSYDADDSGEIFSFISSFLNKELGRHIALWQH
jgi:hypothetical protein